MPPEAEKIPSTAAMLAADFVSLAQKTKKVLDGEGAGGDLKPKPSLRGSLSKAPSASLEDDQITTIAEKVARGHRGFTEARAPQPEKIEMERTTLILPAATCQDLAVKAATARVTKTFLLLKALKDAGFDVPEGALVPDRRARR